ncbi:DUF3253 domain-containing protein [Paremcibacter congregatus]|uniref:DUF3253 domain-containing protein n=1 Tax=Paremcibacter congregatus TaxID=2043170 RepID=UPI0030EF653F|tara:strand:- start:125 stop:460 length:336 start_codon:yes stop_codon:yes gene_type:complete
MKQDNDEIEKEEDPVILYIMNAVERGAPVHPRDIAIEIADDRAKENSPKDAWRKYLIAVKQQAKNLARQGRISILRRGVPIDPNKMKGLVKLSLPVEGAPTGRRENDDEEA